MSLYECLEGLLLGASGDEVYLVRGQGEAAGRFLRGEELKVIPTAFKMLLDAGAAPCQMSTVGGGVGGGGWGGLHHFYLFF